MINDVAILKRLAGIKEIPTLPEVMQNVLVAIASDDSSAEDLAKILSTDQSLCAKVLKIANSAFFAQRRKIFNMGDAIVLLGFDQITRIMLATAVFDVLRSLQRNTLFDLYGFWKHSIATALAGKAIAERIGKPVDSKAIYTAGLLHDMGKLVLLAYFADLYSLVFKRLEAKELYMYEAETAELGFTHCCISEWLCNRWDFPPKLIRCIAGHHSGIPAEPLSEPLRDSETFIIRLADILCNGLNIGNSGNTKAFSLVREDYLGVGLGDSDIRAVETSLRASKDEIDLILDSIV